MKNLLNTTTSAQVGDLARWPALVSRHPVSIYFAATFVISWTGAFTIVAPAVLRGEPVRKIAGLMMFPIMLLGPCLTGIAVVRITGGNSGLPFLKTFVSPAYTPNRFFMGIAYGGIAGFVEEIGWSERRPLGAHLH